jgi:acyl-CoA thioesterase-1
VKSIRYVSLGDSSGVGVGAGADGGYPARLARKLSEAGYDVAHARRSESGATSDDVVRSQLGWTRAPRPGNGRVVELVTLGIGGNDLWRMVPVDRFAANLRTIADAVVQTGASLVVTNVIDLSLAPAAALADRMLGIGADTIRERIHEMNRAFATLANERVHVVDLFAFSSRELPAHPEYFSGDGFHPSAQGYDRWAELMWPAVSAVASTA